MRLGTPRVFGHRGHRHGRCGGDYQSWDYDARDPLTATGREDFGFDAATNLVNEDGVAGVRPDPEAVLDVGLRHIGWLWDPAGVKSKVWWREWTYADSNYSKKRLDFAGGGKSEEGPYILAAG
ncbi:MAG TPA: hypothetical protein PKE56_07260 [Acidimicrobiales bacterium]|nr:hypothetical protein [Acidimicrobiales bacterium]